MQPRFRSDLTSSREEQQGVVFYRIDDPQTQTSFRLYEIEFLIAKKLDGSRSLPQVIAAVKSEYNFDISEPDLKKFVSQLESMGFIEGAGAASGGPSPVALLDQPTTPSDAHEDATAPAKPPPPPPEETEGEEMFAAAAEGPLEEDTREIPPEARDAARGESVEVVAAADFDPRRATATEDETLRMIKTAFEHLRQGYVVHARDYILAAKESLPDDERLTKIVSHLQMLPDAAEPAELRRVWKVCTETFPDLASEVSGEPADSRDDEPAEEDLRSRVIWTVVLLSIVGIGIAALVYVVKAARIFEGTAQVQTVALESARIPVFFRDSAKSVDPMREQWLTVGAGGKVTSVTGAGKRVEQGDTLAVLNIKAKVKKKLDQAQAQLGKMTAQYDKAAATLNEVIKEREGVKNERDEAEAKLKELRPKSILKSGGVSKRDLEKYKRALVKANKKLTKLAKKERKPRAQEKKAKAKVEAARKKLAALEGRIGAKLLKAPFAGLVVEVRLVEGDVAKEGQKALLLRDPLAARITFIVDDPGVLQPGGEAHVAVANGAPSSGKIVTLEAAEGGKKLAVNLTDPAGSFFEMEPSAFRLVREFAEPAFSIDTDAIVDDADGVGASVYVAQQGRAVRRAVDVLERNPNRSVVRSPSGSLRDGDPLIVAFPAEGKVGALLDDAQVEATPKP